MANSEQKNSPRLSAGYRLAPIHALTEETPLAICVLVRTHADPDGAMFILLRELPGARVYLGAVCDAEARIQEWVEIAVQTLQVQELAFSGYQTQLSNLFFDQGWLAESARLLDQVPEACLAVRMESHNTGPILIMQSSPGMTERFAPIEATHWRVCTDDAVLAAHGLDPFSGSPFRYLHEPAVRENKTFLSTSPEAPVNSHAQSLERLGATPGVSAVFNPEAGFVRVTRHAPLSLDDYLQIMEGKPWQEAVNLAGAGWQSNPYAALQEWSSNPKGLPFLLHGDGSLADRLNEVFFLKLSAVFDAFNEVRRLVKAHQLPLLNLSPASFHVWLPETGGQFPALWAARCRLAKAGQAFPLKIKSTEQKYFLRLGRAEPSPFLPEGMGAHSFGIGNVQIRNVTTETDGVVLEGTLVAEDYLGLDPHDLLWFKLPLGEERLDFYAHVYKTDAGGPREARFRTVPARLPEATVAALKRTAGTRFPKSPYEIWPLLSSPCDLYSLAVLTTRILLAHNQSNLPVILDEISSLARRLGDAAKDKKDHLAELRGLLARDENLLNLTSPHSLIGGSISPQQANAAMSRDIWLETLGWLLRLFPDTGSSSFCRDFGDVSPLALETVFDAPIQQLESLLLRQRSILAPSLSENEEISNVILEQLKNL
jgi:hypothetical protein